MGDKFRKGSDQGPILTLSSESVFTTLHQGINSVSTGFHPASFTPSSLQPSEIKGESTHDTLDFSENFHTARIFDGLNHGCAVKLHKENEEQNKLTELCQPSDGEDLENVSTPKLVNTNCLENIASGQGLSHTLQDNLSANHDKGTYSDHVTRPGNMDSSDASDLLQEIQEENKIRMHGIFSPFHVDETDMLELERLSQEKNALFSENLGLIAKNSKEFKTLTKVKPMSKRVRTRKTLLNSPVIDSETVPEAGHKHIKCTYKCGKCCKQFTEMCKLHDHLMNHGYGGSYHYDHILKIAFPKYDSSCAYTQTVQNPLMQDTNQSSPRKLSIKPLRNVVKPRAKNVSKNVKEKKTATENNSKRKAHQVKKPVKADQKKTSEKPSNKKPIAKLKVRTKDGGNTWQGIEVDASQKTEDKEKASGEVSVNDIYIDNAVDAETKDRDEQTSMLVDKYMKEIENDIAALIDSDKTAKRIEKPKLHNSKKDTVRKRKMSVPKKLITAGSTPGKIVNSRVKSEKKIVCDFCPCRFQYTRGLIRHEQEKHADKMKFECEICHMKFMRQYNKERHVLCSHTPGKAKTQQVDDDDIRKEKKKPGRKPKEKMTEGNEECNQCGMVLPHSKAVIHARLHSGERPFICHICGKGLISDKKLKRHLLIHSSVTRHTCEVCGQGFSMKYKLRTHMYIHTGHKPYLCSVCGAEFNNSTSLLHHHRTVHLGDKRFECKICGGKYGKKSQLEEHMFSHSSERTQTCRYCGKTFKHAKSLRRHEYTHVSSEKFQCDQCDSKFSRKDNLERHKMCHFEVTLQCRFCKKKFREKKPLDEHEQYHLKQKRLQCHICKEKFQDEGYFYNHMEKQHQITKDLLPSLNISTLDAKEDKEMEIAVGGADSNLIISSLRMAVCENSGETATKFVTSAGHQDTLNLSMNAAGIIPTSSQNMMGNVAPTSMLLVAQNNIGGQQIFNQSTVNTNGNRARILNQPSNPSFVTAAHILPGLHDGHRTIVNLINTDDNSSICLPIDQSVSESIVVQEQQRLMQETSGSSLNVQNSAYRLQNLY